MTTQPTEIPAWWNRMLAALDAGNVDTFCSFLADDCRFVFANIPPVDGREAIFEFVAGFLKSIETLDHRLEEEYRAPGRSIGRGEVTYTRLDGSTLTLPFCNVLELGDDGIELYQIYVDNSAL